MNWKKASYMQKIISGMINDLNNEGAAEAVIRHYNGVAIDTSKVVCDYYHLTKQQLAGSIRTKNIANARHISIYLCRKLLNISYLKIGEEFGGRDHSTIMSACTKVEKQIKKDPMYENVIKEIEKQLNV